jgi:putative aminopeptidase FrvX
MFELIKELTELVGPVGQERPVVDHVEHLWRDMGAQITRTRIGNLVAHWEGEQPTLLLAAHADELCYLVRAIHPDGFLLLANGQGWERTTSVRNWYTVGQRVHVLARSGTLPGIIGAVTGHLASLALPEPKEMTWNDLWVDTGLSRAELLERGVTPGTRIVWDAPTYRLGPHIVGKAFDDRVLLAVITEVARRVPPAERGWNIHLGCTVQEEIGVIGAAALAAKHDYDAAIVLEIGLAGDVPGVDDTIMPTRLGAGPILLHKDALVHSDWAMNRALETVAAEQNIPIQHAIFGSFGTDASFLMRSDIPCGQVAFPARYTHSPFETAHMDDIEALTEWLCAFVRKGM